MAVLQMREVAMLGKRLVVNVLLLRYSVQEVSGREGWVEKV